VKNEDESSSSEDSSYGSAIAASAPGKRRRKKKSSTKDKRLPTNYAERVLELEMQLERDCSNIDSVN
jgi:hypothetical protein